MPLVTIKRTLGVLPALMFSIFGLAQTSAADTSYVYTVPPQLGDGITTTNIAGAGIDSAGIINLTKLILNGTFTNIHSLLIARNNTLVYENYFKGTDEVWGLKTGNTVHTVNSMHDVRSISKSIVSACIGIAIMQKKINSVDDPIFSYLPGYTAYKTEQNSGITIRQLLTMTSGIKWDEDTPHGTTKNDETQMERNPDPVAYTLSLPMAEKPGAVWNYNSGGVQVLATIIQQASGYRVDSFAQKFLFAPLGIENYQWITLRKNIPAAASGLRLRPRDLLKIGLLYLNKGKYNNQQVIPEIWVKQSMSTMVLRDGATKTKGYGYLFWVQTDTVVQKPYTIVSARGNGGERLFIDTRHKLTVVVTAGNYNQPNIVNDGQRALVKYILPALR